MSWYCCHVIQAFRARDDRRLLSIYENMLLIEASNFDEALSKGQQLASEKYQDTDDSLNCAGVPASTEVAGIRKVIAFERYDGPSLDGVEATYSELLVESEDDLKALVAGERVRVSYEE